MDRVLEFLAEMHGMYLHTSKYDKGGCQQLALEVALRLIEAGEPPSMYEVSADGSFTPKLFKIDLGWNLHYVTCTKDTAYDPVVSKPMDRLIYTKEVFNKPVEMRVVINNIEFHDCV